MIIYYIKYTERNNCTAHFKFNMINYLDYVNCKVKHSILIAGPCMQSDCNAAKFNSSLQFRELIDLFNKISTVSLHIRSVYWSTTE